MIPVHEQRDADAAFGAAWRLCESSLGSDAYLSVHRYEEGYVADTNGSLAYYGETPAEALRALAAALAKVKADRDRENKPSVVEF